jgi:hypothetical protein
MSDEPIFLGIGPNASFADTQLALLRHIRAEKPCRCEYEFDEVIPVCTLHFTVRVGVNGELTWERAEANDSGGDSFQ